MRKKTLQLKEAQSTCPTTEIIEITSAKDMIRTVEKQNLFNGPWLLTDLPQNRSQATITVWKRTNGSLKPQTSKADQSGMLDTARQMHWIAIQAVTPTSDNAQDVELLRRATAWNAHANPPTLDKSNPKANTNSAPDTPKSPPKKRPQLQRPTNGPRGTQPPTNPGHPQNPTHQPRYDLSNELLKDFRYTPRPLTITKHLDTTIDQTELTRLDAELTRYQPESPAYTCLQADRIRLIQRNIADATLSEKAQQLNLSAIKVIGDGNCLLYAVNATHKEQTGLYLANNDNLRLLATTLART